MGRKLYRGVEDRMLNVVSMEEALAFVDEASRKTKIGSEIIPLSEACGRVLSADVLSAENVPAFDRSVMDGYALNSADSFGASETMPAMLRLVGEIKMGKAAGITLKSGECAKIPTGGMLPEGADAVVPYEYTELPSDDLCLCFQSLGPFTNVSRKGDDVAEGETILRKGTTLNPASIGVLAALGRETVEVFEKPKLGIISTGNELVEIAETPESGKVRDVNSHMLFSLFSSFGCVCKKYGIVKDEKELLFNAVMKAVDENDLVLISGGSSAGEADLTKEILDELGAVLFHGIAAKPGKPTMLGLVDGRAVFGLPGHPAACYFMAAILVGRYVGGLLGVKEKEAGVSASLSEHLSSNHGREEIVCVRLENGKAVPVRGKSGVISQLASSDGYIIIPRDCEGLKEGSSVSVRLF